MHKLTASGAVWLPALFALWLAGVVQAQSILNWTAFNDHYAGLETSNNATAWNVFDTLSGAPGNSGPLKNIATGELLPVSLTISSSGALGQGTSSGAPNPDTPAYQVFDEYIDWSSGPSPTAVLIYPGSEVVYDFGGLDSSKRYRFVGTSIRGGFGGNYPLRWTLIELMGADSFTPAHTTGAASYTNGLPAAQVAINSGQNSATGDCAEWENIAPGADGAFTIRCTYYDGPIPDGSAGGPYSYALMAIRLQEFDSVPRAAAISVQPEDPTVLELTSASFQALAVGNPIPTYQWYKNGEPISRATNATCTLVSALLSDHRATFFVVASNWVQNASCLATSRVATLTVLADTAPPLLLNTLPPTNATVTSLQSIEVFFNKPVTGVTAADLLIDGVPATNVNYITPSQYFFEFVSPPAGTIQVAWSATHAITDLTAAANRFGGGGWTYRLDTNIIYSIRINEFMAANKNGIRDEDGDYADWIELYNSGSMTVPLTGCYLTDDHLNLTKWQFPPMSLIPNSYLLVWASGKNRTNSIAPLHTSFQLDKEGGFLALVTPDGTNLISAFTPSYPPQRADVSYGLDRTDPSLTGFFTTPTPRAANATTGTGFGPEVRFSRASGTFIAPFSLWLSTTTTNAVIRYTLGTNAPTAASTLYTGPISVGSSVQVRARAFVPGLFPGDIQSREYLFLDPAPDTIPGSSENVRNFSSSLPILVFHNYGGGSVPYSDPGQFAVIQVFEPQNGRSSLTNRPDLAVHGTIHRRGQATRYNPKANLRVEIQDEYGGNKNVSLLGFPADDDWVLYGINEYDKVLMHNPLAHELYRQLGHYSSRTRFVEVYLRESSGAPGPITAADYNGLYVLEEKIKLAKDRVDIDPLQPENTNAPSITGGYLLSIDKDGPSPALSAANSSLWCLDPDGPTLNTPQRAPQRQYIANYLNAFYAALTGPNWTNPVTGYAAYLDVPVWIDFNLHQVLVFNADMLRISSYYCKPRHGKFSPAALWDFDRAFAMYAEDGDQRGFNPWRWHSGYGDRGTDPFNADGDGGFWNPWYSKLFQDPDFWQKWIDRYQELRRTVYSSSNVTALIEHYGGEVAEATDREYARWSGSWSSDTTPNEGDVYGDGWSYTFPIPGTWPAEVEFVKTWFTNRLTFMDTNFLALPTVSRTEGQLDYGSIITIAPASKAGSSLLYTLDGTDPRLPGGAVSPAALSNNGPVTLALTNNVRIFARSRNPNHRNLTGAHNPPLSSPWSGVTVGTYYLAVPALRITGIMYHPGQPPNGNTNDANNYEYVELTNTGTNSLSLLGFKLTHGIEFTFSATNWVTNLPAGGRVLIVKSLAAFASRYPEVTNLVAGEFTGQLNNAGDRLALTGPLGEPIHDFTYDNQWYPITDGLGFSLVVADEHAALGMWTQPAQWRASAYDGGSPGVPAPAPVAVQPVLVNEILSNPVPPQDDALELWNPNASPVDIGYWYLTDNVNVPRKYMIPPGAAIPGFGFAVFYRTNSFGVPDTTNALGQTNEPFGLSMDGDEVYLFSGDSNGRLTGYYQGFDFGPAAPGVSFGRHTDSLGQTRYVAQSAVTLGSANAVPQVGPAIITEVMYAPPNLLVSGLVIENTRDEFIEVHNTAGYPLPLYDTNNPANIWHIRDGVQFDFPPGVILPPDGFLLVVSFSPDADPVSLAAFQSHYGLSNNASIYGPYVGQLNNAGDRLELRQPGSPDPITHISPMVLVDRIEYGVANPWPASANGSGASLQRKDYAAFGNDPGNWIAAAPSPGWGNVSARLAIELQNPNVAISWPDSPLVWRLEEATDLAAPTPWQPVGTSPVLAGGRWRVTAPISATANKYFRLKNP